MWAMTDLALSVLDQSIAVSGAGEDQAIRDTIAMARHCEALGYRRFWVSEHHNHESIVGTAPEILIAAMAAVTSRIRLGSAGVMYRIIRPCTWPSSSACWTPSRPAASIWAWAARRVGRPHRLCAQSAWRRRRKLPGADA